MLVDLKLEPVGDMGKGNLVQSMALFGTVAAMLTVTVMVTLSHATFSMSGVGSLKCYVTAGIEKAC